MKISLNWLRQYVSWDGSLDKLSDLLTFAGVEVEGFHSTGASFDKVVVAQILESLQHPDAERLSVCKVDDGSGQPRQIVCGAKNYKIGDKVPLALPGAVLPGDFKIKTGKLRGVTSEGMMCSAKELQLAEDADGLLILPADTKVGIPIGAALPSDTVIEIEVTPNRPDLLSHVGLARELATLLKTELKRPPAGADFPVLSPGSVRLESEKCPFYTFVRVQNVNVGPSPAWLVERLESVGLRPINNIVDITNFVMLELGQPLHAFDADKLNGEIVVRESREGEKLLALDGREYALHPGDLVIADANTPIAIAGVMGGEPTGVTAATKNILLESAWFQPQSVRRTSRTLGLISESSYRFERRVDPGGVVASSLRALGLILELTGGTAACAVLAGDAPAKHRQVTLRYDRCASLIGIRVPNTRIDEILTRFGLQKHGPNTAEASHWTIPSFRADLEREVDLIEEICRVHGMDHIPSVTIGRFSPSSEIDRRYDAEMLVRQKLVAMGFSETKTVTLISKAQLENDFFSNTGSEPIRLKNPLGEDQALLRPSLSPGLIATLERNVRQGLRDLRLFELGVAFGGSKEESRKLGLVWTGATVEADWKTKSGVADFYDFKGIIECLLGEFTTLKVENDPRLVIAFDIKTRGKIVGRFGQVGPAKSRSFDLRESLFVAELDASAVAAAATLESRIKPLPKFPAVTRDAAIVVANSLSHSEIENTIRSSKEPLLSDLQLFDIFTDPTGQKLPADQKSMAYSFTYRSPERTLTAEDVNRAHEKIKSALIAKLAVQFRE